MGGATGNRKARKLPFVQAKGFLPYYEEKIEFTTKDAEYTEITGVHRGPDLDYPCKGYHCKRHTLRVACYGLAGA